MKKLWMYVAYVSIQVTDIQFLLAHGQGSVYFRVNFDKFNIHIRNKVRLYSMCDLRWVSNHLVVQLIETAARERFNDSVALVIRAILKATEAKQISVSDIRSGANLPIICVHHTQARLDPISTANIAMQLSDDDDLSKGLVLNSSKTPSNVSLLKDYIGMLSSADSPTPAGRAASFVSLAGSKVQVEFEIVCRRLRRVVLEAVTRERHGDDGVRILRLLLNTGKMDEKQVRIQFPRAICGQTVVDLLPYNRSRKWP
jgi:DNA-directed RNA polymerase III subunit RPC3